MFGLATTFAVRLPYRRWRAFHFALALVFCSLWLMCTRCWRSGYAAVADRCDRRCAGLAFDCQRPWHGLASIPCNTSRTPVWRYDRGAAVTCAAAITVAPGQFVLVAFGDGQAYRGCGEYHPFTVSGIEADGGLRVGIKALGTCSQRLQSLEPEVLVRLQGPFGSFLLDSPFVPQLWIAGGVGITPFMAALRAHACIRPTTLIYLFRKEAMPHFSTNSRLWQRQTLNLSCLPMHPTKGCPIFLNYWGKLARSQHVRCLSAARIPMVEALLPLLCEIGIAEESIHFERFDFR